jgi:hypothetical protein
MPVGAQSGDLPYIAFYEAERAINWSREHDFFVLDETRLVRNGFTWWPIRRYRVLALDETGHYQVQIFDMVESGQVYDEPEPTLPQKRGGEIFGEIPLTVIGALDLAVEPGEIPLLGVAQAALASYRLDADYRHQLYMSGQETFVVTGISKDETPEALGASVILTFPENAKAQYVSPSCKGIEAHRLAIQDEVEAAAIAMPTRYRSACRSSWSIEPVFPNFPNLP